MQPIKHGAVNLYNSERYDSIVCASNTVGDYTITYINGFALTSDPQVEMSEKTGTYVCTDKTNPNCWYAILAVRKNASSYQGRIQDGGQIINEAPLDKDSVLNT